MVEKGPLVEGMDISETKQRNNVLCTISCQVIYNSFTDKLTNKYSFSYQMTCFFITFLHSSKDNTS